MTTLLQRFEAICDEIFDRWDKDMKPGKLLSALAGRLENYRDDVTEVRKSLTFDITVDRERDLLEANNRYLTEKRAAVEAMRGGFQDRAGGFMTVCFGADVAADQVERNHRFLEEALELAQACACTAEEAYQLVDYVFGRPTGEPRQETGGVMLTLAALCNAHGIDMAIAGETELASCWNRIDRIRAKQAAKPKLGPLPGKSPTDSLTGDGDLDRLLSEANARVADMSPAERAEHDRLQRESFVRGQMPTGDPRFD